MSKNAQCNMIIFGAGKNGKEALRILSKGTLNNILFIVDNDSNKWGGDILGISIKSPDELRNLIPDDFITVITISNYSPIVIQLENMDIRNYIYYMDLYQNDYDCASRSIMDANIPDNVKGQYMSQHVKNCWMNHLRCNFAQKEYLECMTEHAKILDVGCGCGTLVFNWLCKDYDAYGLDCCDWKLQFCRQKIDDFGFPDGWKNRFKFGVGEKLPWGNDMFDIVSSWYVLEHVDDYKQCISEMFRVVKKDRGTLFIAAPDYSNTYEEHYGIDIGCPINTNQDKLKKVLIEKNLSLDTFNELNFITKHDVMTEIDDICNEYKFRKRIIDIEELNPQSLVTHVDNKLRYQRYIKLIVQLY